MDKSSVVKWVGFSIPGYTYDVCGWARRFACVQSESIDVKKGENCARLFSGVSQVGKRPLGDYGVSKKADECGETQVEAAVEKCSKEIKECKEKMREYDRKIRCISRAFIDFVYGAAPKVNVTPRGFKEIKGYY